jgi:hypothetical protein
MQTAVLFVTLPRIHCREYDVSRVPVLEVLRESDKTIVSKVYYKPPYNDMLLKAILGGRAALCIPK